MLTACFLSIISRVTQLAPKQGEEQGRWRERESKKGGREKWKESGEQRKGISWDKAEKWLNWGRKGRVVRSCRTFQEVYPDTPS